MKRVYNSVERFSFSNFSSTQGPFNLRGGSYGLSVIGTFSGGSVTLQRLSPDGATFVTVIAAFSAAGYASANLPSGTYQLAVATATGVYADVVGIATSE